MSTRVNTLKKYIRELIKLELKELEEASVTGAIDGGEGPSKTPFAFSGGGKKDKKKKDRIVKAGGYEEVNEGKYHEYKKDESMTPKQKIGNSMREVKNSLSELSKLIDMNVKLKNELNVDSQSYWKNTHKALHKISERLVKLANKVGQLQ
jgi:hypothetical protein